MNIHSSVTQSDELIDKVVLLSFKFNYEKLQSEIFIQLFPETKVFEIKSISRINFINNSKLELVQTEDDKHWVNVYEICIIFIVSVTLIISS